MKISREEPRDFSITSCSRSRTAARSGRSSRSTSAWKWRRHVLSDLPNVEVVGLLRASHEVRSGPGREGCRAGPARRVGLRIRVSARRNEPGHVSGCRNHIPHARRAVHVRLGDDRAGNIDARRRHLEVRAAVRRERLRTRSSNCKDATRIDQRGVRIRSQDVLMALMITDACINCDVCEPECPNEAISAGEEYLRDRSREMHRVRRPLRRAAVPAACVRWTASRLTRTVVETKEQLHEKYLRLQACQA